LQGREGWIPDYLQGREGWVPDWLENIPRQTGLRRGVADLLGIDSSVSSLFGLGLNSILNSDEVNLTGDLLFRASQDPGVLSLDRDVEQQILQYISDNIVRPSGGSTYVSTFQLIGGENVPFGGTRTPDSVATMGTQLRGLWRPEYSATRAVGMDPLTWTFRNARVEWIADATVIYARCNLVGVYSISHTVADTLDLRPRSGRRVDFSTQYNTATTLLGVPYHDVLGITDQLTVRAEWSSYGVVLGE
jgi:hypothetical protein